VPRRALLIGRLVRAIAVEVVPAVLACMSMFCLVLCAEELGVDLSLFFSFIMISASGFKVRLGYVIQPYGRTRIIHFYFM
jgi:hypothetical protein